MKSICTLFYNACILSSHTSKEFSKSSLVTFLMSVARSSCLSFSVSGFSSENKWSGWMYSVGLKRWSVSPALRWAFLVSHLVPGALDGRTLGVRCEFRSSALKAMLIFALCFVFMSSCKNNTKILLFVISEDPASEKDMTLFIPLWKHNNKTTKTHSYPLH